MHRLGRQWSPYYSIICNHSWSAKVFFLYTSRWHVLFQLLEVYCRDAVGSVGEENYLHLINAYFSAASGQGRFHKRLRIFIDSYIIVFTLRQILAENDVSDVSS